MSARREPQVDLALAREHGLSDGEYADTLQHRFSLLEIAVSW